MVKLQLGKHAVGDGCPVYMIGEIGINHNGDLKIAKRLLDSVFACGWHCAKFQKRTPDICVPDHQKKIMRETPWGPMTYLDYRHHMEFNRNNYDYIDNYCKIKPLAWTASPWDIQSLEFLKKYDIPFIKIPSAMLTNHELLARAGESGKPIVLSTGMSTVSQIDDAVNVLERKSSGYALMHTNSAYPTPPEEINILAIQFLKSRYNCVVGYSGHEYGLDPTITAVALGARIIERHITLDHSMWGTDQKASLEVHAMDMLHKRVKETLVSLGDGIKKIQDGEIQVLKKLRG